MFAAAGAAALAWGAWLAWEFASRHDAIQAAFWLVGAPVVHDALMAPAVGIGGLLIVRVLPTGWRVPVAVGAGLSGVLALLSVPLLWRPFGVATNPGLHDGNYTRSLLIALGVVWVGVVIAGMTNAARGR